MTIFDLNTLPKPSDIELETMDRQAWARCSEGDADTTAPDPTVCCCFNYYVRVRNINGERPYFHEFLVEQGRAHKALTIAQWDSLLAVFDARDLRNTLNDARNAGTG